MNESWVDVSIVTVIRKCSYSCEFHSKPMAFPTIGTLLNYHNYSKTFPNTSWKRPKDRNIEITETMPFWFRSPKIFSVVQKDSINFRKYYGNSENFRKNLKLWTISGKSSKNFLKGCRDAQSGRIGRWVQRRRTSENSVEKFRKGLQVLQERVPELQERGTRTSWKGSANFREGSDNSRKKFR